MSEQNGNTGLRLKTGLAEMLPALTPAQDSWCPGPRRPSSVLSDPPQEALAAAPAVGRSVRFWAHRTEFTICAYLEPGWLG